VDISLWPRFFWAHPVYRLFACSYGMLPTCLFLLHLFLTYLLPYLSFPLRIDPLRFQTGCRKRRLNLALVFLCLFCVVLYFFDWVLRASVVLGLVFFHTKPRDWLRERLRNDIFCVEWDIKPQPMSISKSNPSVR